MRLRTVSSIAGGLAHQARLPQEREAEHQHHEAGRREQRDGERGVGAPFGEHDAAALRDRELAERRVEVAQREQDARPVGERDSSVTPGWIMTAGVARIAADRLVQLAADVAVERRLRRDDRAACVGQQHHAAGRGRARPVDALEGAEAAHHRIAGFVRRPGARCAPP